MEYNERYSENFLITLCIYVMRRVIMITNLVPILSKQHLSVIRWSNVLPMNWHLSISLRTKKSRKHRSISLPWPPFQRSKKCVSGCKMNVHYGSYPYDFRSNDHQSSSKSSFALSSIMYFHHPWPMQTHKWWRTIYFDWWMPRSSGTPAYLCTQTSTRPEFRIGDGIHGWNFFEKPPHFTQVYIIHAVNYDICKEMKRLLFGDLAFSSLIYLVCSCWCSIKKRYYVSENIFRAEANSERTSERLFTHAHRFWLRIRCSSSIEDWGRFLMSCQQHGLPPWLIYFFSFSQPRIIVVIFITLNHCTRGYSN